MVAKEDRVKRIFGILMMMVLSLSSTVYGQDGQPPLLILTFGEDVVYQYEDGQVTPLDNCAPRGESRQLSTIWVSPDGFRYAFLTSAPNVGGTANNLRICDLESGSLIPVTGQPQTQIIHSSPTWSLDGDKLAFARLIQGQNRMELVIYDLASRNEDVVYEREMPVSGSSLPPQVVWGAIGVVAFNTNITDQTRPQASEYVWYPQEFIVQDRDGEAVVRLLDSFYESIEIIRRGHPTATSYVVSNYNQPGRALDLATNETVDLPADSTGWMNPLAPDVVAGQMMLGTNPEWIINGPTFSAALSVPVSTSNSLAVSPNGEQVAFITFENYPYGGKVYIIEDFEAFIMSMGSGQAQGVTQVAAFDAHYGEPGAIGVYWGPLVPALPE